ncbi:MAG: PQQ-binding-like beta-propeller repeat protein [Candidatus Methanoplasma sp.]|nr:PQQ-binding-like beta-propeller repeat protein [Candidatus Methanoplasma sp.]
MKRIVLIFVIAVLVFPPVSGTSSAVDGGKVLLDLGNGRTFWYPAEGNTYGSAAEMCALQYGIDADVSGSVVIDGITSSAAGAHWSFYIWDGKWVYRPDLSSSSPYSGGTFALAFYPDGIFPAVTPDEPFAWTQFGGSSSAMGESYSGGPEEPALPVEWYKTYTTGYIDSGIVAAGDLLYHTTGGAFGVGGIDKDPWVYCINRYDGSEVWKFHGVYGTGYEVTTPLIVDSMLIVTSTSGNVYLFDRFTGEVLDTVSIPFEPPMDPSGDILWDGRVFVTGGTTPVYDSGAVFFGSADGKVYSYAVSEESGFRQIWTYDPSVGKGCFYYHAPTVAGIDGKRILFIGNYDGFVHALDVSTGKAVWVRQVVDLSADNIPQPGTPGSAASISVSPKGDILLVGCTDGGMGSITGFLLGLDPKTGTSLTADGKEWRIDVLATSPAVSYDGFYTYVSQSAAGASSLENADGTSEAVSAAIYKFDWSGKVIWHTRTYQLMKAPLTLASGVIYSMDYSAGGFWPTGGGLTAVSADDGHEIWRVLLAPYSADSYCMVQPTVIDGRVYVGNDYGAMYCLSGNAGPSSEGTDIVALQTVGFAHWSWVMIALISVIAAALLIRYY